MLSVLFFLASWGDEKKKTEAVRESQQSIEESGVEGKKKMLRRQKKGKLMAKEKELACRFSFSESSLACSLAFRSLREREKSSVTMISS